MIEYTLYRDTPDEKTVKMYPQQIVDISEEPAIRFIFNYDRIVLVTENKEELYVVIDESEVDKYEDANYVVDIVFDEYGYKGYTLAFPVDGIVPDYIELDDVESDEWDYYDDLPCGCCSCCGCSCDDWDWDEEEE